MKNIIIENSDRFKSVSVAVNLLLPLNGIDNSKNALLAMVLKKSNELYKNEKELQRELAKLYDTTLDVNVEKIDNLYNIQFYMEVLNIKYMSKEDIRKAEEILCTVVCLPNISQGLFDANIFKREKASLIEKIKEERDDKRKYAIKCLEQDMFKTTDYGVSALGTIEDVESLTNEDLVKHYKFVINNAKLVVTAVGNLNQMEDFPTNIYNRISGQCGIHNVENIKNVENIAKQIESKEEKQDIAQSVLCIGLKLKDATKQDIYKMALYNSIMGGTPASKLFQNVREKESLAYFAKSMYNKHKQAIYMFSGIDPKNHEKAKAVMLEQVKLLKEAEISDVEFKAAKQNIVSAYKELQDSKSGMLKTMLSNEIYFDTKVDINEMIHEFEKLEIGDIVEIAKRVQVTNIFLLGGVSNV